MSSFKQLLLLILIAVDSGMSTGPVIFDCPDNDIFKRLLPYNDFTLITWDEPFSRDGTMQRTHIPPHYFRRGEHEIIYTFTNGSSSSKCEFVVVVTSTEIDTSPPLVQCPDDITASVSSATQVVPVTWPSPLITDNSGHVEISNQSIAPGSDFSFGFTPVTVTAKDAGNLTSRCTFVVKVGLVGDTTPPEILGCPNDITHIAVSGRSDTVSWKPPSAEDIGLFAGSVRLAFQSHQPGDTFNEGDTQVRFIFEDSSGNKEQCTFTVTIQVDKVKPVILNCPREVRQTVLPDQLKTDVWWLEPTASDESGNVELIDVSKLPGSLFGVGIENVTYVFADNTDNTAECRFPVILTRDDTPPVIQSCPTDVVEEVPFDTDSISVSWTRPHAYDNSGTVILLNYTHASGSSFSMGTSTVAYWFTDLSQNVAVCKFTITVTVVDRIKPEISSCPSNFNLTLPVNGAPVFWASPTAMDNSGEVRLVSVTHESGSRFYEGNTTVLYSFADSSGNTADCSFVVTAAINKGLDVENCPQDINVTLSGDTSEIAVSWSPEPTLSSGMEESSLKQSRQSGDLFAFGVTKVEYVWLGTPFTCVFHIHVEVNVTDVAEGRSNKNMPEHVKIYIGLGSAVAALLLLILITCIACTAYSACS